MTVGQLKSILAGAPDDYTLRLEIKFTKPPTWPTIEVNVKDFSRNDEEKAFYLTSNK